MCFLLYFIIIFLLATKILWSSLTLFQLQSRDAELFTLYRANTVVWHSVKQSCFTQQMTGTNVATQFWLQEPSGKHIQTQFQKCGVLCKNRRKSFENLRNTYFIYNITQKIYKKFKLRNILLFHENISSF